MVFASYGVLCWISSAAAWMRSATACLRPGGALVLIDMHPLVGMLETADPLVVDFPYAREQPITLSSANSYALGDLEADARETTQWAHGLGEIVTAASAAGLRIEALTEWFDETKDPKLVVSADGRGRFPVGSEYLPTSYGLRVRKVLSTTIEFAVANVGQEGVPLRWSEAENRSLWVLAVTNANKIARKTSYLDTVAVCHAPGTFPPPVCGIAS